MSLRLFIDTLNLCEEESSRKSKEGHLENIKDNRFLQQTCRLVFDPFVTLGVTAPELLTEGDTAFQTEDELYDNFMELITLLSRRSLTGSAAQQRVSAFLISIVDQNIRAWFTRFLNKKFVTGVGPTTITKIYPELKSAYGVQLASPLDNWDFLSNGSTWVAEPKMDGIRCIFFLDPNNNAVALSRNLKELNIENLRHIVSELNPLLSEGYVVDGELLATNWNDTTSIAMSQFEHPNRETLNFYIFDILPFSAFLTGGSPLPQRQRSKTISLFFAQKNSWKHLVRVEQVLITDQKDAEEVTSKFVSAGYEGSVLKDLNSTYENKRSKSWIKVKPVLTEDLPIVGVVEGDGKYSKPPSTRLINKCSKDLGIPASELKTVPCLLGRIDVQDPSGAVSGVGSGFSDCDRLYFMYLHRKGELIGKLVEVEFQNKTEDAALRFGVFVRLRTDK